MEKLNGFFFAISKEKESQPFGVTSFNPLTPKSAMWHNIPLHAQYLVNFLSILNCKKVFQDSAVVLRHKIISPFHHHFSTN